MLSRHSCIKATSVVAFFFEALNACRTVAAPALAVLLVVVGLLTWAGPSDARTLRARVDNVLDGDTLVLTTGERVRLRGIDTPEIRHGANPGQFYGQEAKKLLVSLVLGRDVFMESTELSIDRYGRSVGMVRLGDGRLVNLVLVEEGAAFVYPFKSDTDARVAERLLAVQRAAMSRSKGFWSRLLTIPAASKSYVGNRQSQRFHTESCKTGRKMKKANQVHFSSLREAFNAGFSPARECTPWPSDRFR